MIIGCDEGDDFISNDSDIYESRELMDQSLDKVARILTGLIQQDNLSKLKIIRELSKDFNPPRNTAYELLLPYSNEELVAASNLFYGNSRKQNISDYKALLGNNPTIDIEVPDVKKDMAQWSLDKVTKVVVLDSRYDDKKTENVDAYDVSTGNKILLSTSEPPNEFVIVVKESESKFAIDKLSKKSYHGNDIKVDENKKLFSTDKFNIYTIVDVYVPDVDLNDDINEFNSSIDVRSSCTRDTRTTKDYISKFRFNREETIEDWLETYADIRANIVFNEYLGGDWVQTKLEKVWHMKAKGNLYRCYTWIGCGGKGPIWYNTGTSSSTATKTFTWKNDEIASRIIFRWLEIDRPDWLYEFTITAPSGEITTPGGNKIDSGSFVTKITYSPQDDVLGDAIVEYCDNSNWPGEEYDTGTFKFNVGN